MDMILRNVLHLEHSKSVNYIPQFTLDHILIWHNIWFSVKDFFSRKDLAPLGVILRGFWGVPGTCVYLTLLPPWRAEAIRRRRLIPDPRPLTSYSMPYLSEPACPEFVEGSKDAPCLIPTVFKVTLFFLLPPSLCCVIQYTHFS